MSQQAPAGAEVTPAIPQHSAGLDAAIQPAWSPAQLISATRQAMARVTAVRQPSAGLAGYTVQPGDSLSSIAQRLYHNAAEWPVLFWGNHGQIRWANLIKVGQVLRVPAEPARIPAPPAQLGPPAPPAPPAPRHAKPMPAAAPAPAQQAPQPVSTIPAPSAPTTTSSSQWPGGAFGQCVVERESGGNPNIWNATGHWGLYQFSASTWAEYGGDPAAFGNASVAVQEQVFMNALAQGGEFNWAPYDGC